MGERSRRMADTLEDPEPCTAARALQSLRGAGRPAAATIPLSAGAATAGAREVAHAPGAPRRQPPGTLAARSHAASVAAAVAAVPASRPERRLGRPPAAAAAVAAVALLLLGAGFVALSATGRGPSSGILPISREQLVPIAVPAPGSAGGSLAGVHGDELILGSPPSQELILAAATPRGAAAMAAAIGLGSGPRAGPRERAAGSRGRQPARSRRRASRSAAGPRASRFAALRRVHPGRS